MAMMKSQPKNQAAKQIYNKVQFAAGIDMRTGITTHALHHSQLIQKIPETKVKTRELNYLIGINYYFCNQDTGN